MKRGLFLAVLLLACTTSTAGAQTYDVPPDNPFVGQAGADEVIAIGLRNPFRFSFDRATGDFTLGDVGQATKEEINFVPAGGLLGVNFGWACMEGSVDGPRRNEPDCDPFPDVLLPALEYDNPPVPGQARAVTGGYVIRDGTLPAAWSGRYLYGDFFVGDVRSVVLSESGASDDQSTGVAVSSLVSFGEDVSGRLYVVSLDGEVARLVPGATEGTLAKQTVANFDAPMYVTTPPQSPDQLFVVERAGRIRLYQNGGSSLFLDISSEVSTDVERGMYSMAFAPDYATSGRFFVFYSDTGGDIRVDSFARSASDPTSADPGSRESILAIERPDPSVAAHYGGQLQFGPDGYLYVSTGDGGAFHDNQVQAQDIDSLHGKLLRLDVGVGPSGGPGGAGGSSPAQPVGQTAQSTASPLDTTAPGIRTRIRRRQRVMRNRGVIAYARSTEAGRIVIRARLKIGRRSFQLRRAQQAAAPHRPVRLRARLTRRAAPALRRANQNGGGPATVRIALRAIDRSSNRSRLVRRTISVVG